MECRGELVGLSHVSASDSSLLKTLQFSKTWSWLEGAQVPSGRGAAGVASLAPAVDGQEAQQASCTPLPLGEQKAGLSPFYT